jgi:TolA-binding protein
MRAKRLRYHLLVMTVGVLLPAVASAQQTDSIKADSAAQQQQYEARRGTLVKELQSTQDKLGDLRSQRVRLEARIENVLAETMQKRTQQLLVSKEETALLQLDGVLANAQDNMVAQRDRMRALGDAVRRRAGAVLVVTLRADSAAPGSLGDASLSIDNVVASTRTYTQAAAQALQTGAVDPLYRSEVLPATHTVELKLTLGGQSITQGLNVNALTETVTYVEFTVRNGQLVPTTWTSRGTTPF